MMFGLKPEGVTVLFDSNALLVDDFLEQIVDTGQIPLTTYRCDNESLRTFLSILYPMDKELERNYGQK